MQRDVPPSERTPASQRPALISGRPALISGRRALTSAEPAKHVPTDLNEYSSEADWQLSAWAQLRCTHGGTGEGDPNPTGVHQIWEIGWNDDGSVPTGIMDCDNYHVVASIDGNYTNNDHQFHLLTGGGTISGVAGLQGVAVRARLYNDAAWWWTFMNVDNVEFAVSSVTPWITADFNGDGHVDGSDLDHFRSCISGAGVLPGDPECENADLDGDTDVDQSDFGLFQGCLSGSDLHADPSCAG